MEAIPVILNELQALLMTIKENAKPLATCQNSGVIASQSYWELWGYLETNYYLTGSRVKQAAQTFSTFFPLKSFSSFFSPSFMMTIFAKKSLEIKHVEISFTHIRVGDFHCGISS